MMKPGIKSTEFAIALVVLALMAVGSTSESPLAQSAAYIGAALASAGYGFSRAAAKKSNDESLAAIVREQMWLSKEEKEEAREAAKTKEAV